MKLIDKILRNQDIEMAIRKVKSNKGAAGKDKIPVERIQSIFQKKGEQIKSSIRNMAYRPLPVRSVYIPKPNGKLRPLGIPVVIDRVIQQAISQKLIEIFDSSFSQHSYGFRPKRRAQQAVIKLLGYINNEYTYIVDVDLEIFFDNIPQDKLMFLVHGSCVD